MRMTSTRCGTLFVIAGTLFIGAGVFATIPPCLAGKIRQEGHTPGSTLGETVSRWIAPHVRETLEGVLGELDAETCCCGPGRATVRWYRDDGQVDFELAGEGVQPSNGFVGQHTDTSDATYHGLVPHWTMALPQKSRIYSFITASPVGDLFIHQFYPDSGHVVIDLYREGRLEGSLGPYPSKLGCDQLHVEPWGSMAMATSFDRGEDRISAVLYGRDGEFLVTVPTTTREAHASPSGRRAVFQWQSAMAIVDAEGHRVDLEDRGYPLAVVWGRDETDLLVIASRKDDHTCMMIDTSTGRVQWELPMEGILDWDGPAALVEDLLLIASTGHRDSMHRYRVQAFDWKTGRPVADWGGGTWTSEIRGQPRLMTVGKQVYYVDDRRFSRINIDDIREQRFGWTLTEP